MERRAKRMQRLAVRVTDDLHEQLVRISVGGTLSSTIVAALKLYVVAHALMHEAAR